jgi:hypothetical protein
LNAIYFCFSIQKKDRISLYTIRQLPTRDIAGLWDGCAAKGAGSGDAAARIFLPQLVWSTLTSSFSASTYRIFLIFGSKETSYFSL